MQIRTQLCIIYQSVMQNVQNVMDNVQKFNKLCTVCNALCTKSITLCNKCNAPSTQCNTLCTKILPYVPNIFQTGFSPHLSKAVSGSVTFWSGVWDFSFALDSPCHLCNN